MDSCYVFHGALCICVNVSGLLLNSRKPPAPRASRGEQLLGWLLHEEIARFIGRAPASRWHDPSDASQLPARISAGLLPSAPLTNLHSPTREGFFFVSPG